ncbi:winged helix-turn-helix transcriptional regulator [Mucilaginibacter angelicae]|uniref:Winged helix-turn-helix transcriptional regulator n=1 Tax=Mucilaginibacter angelicae TaxID=869718 RepID=A0ABV6L961_9SPHI
MDNEKIIIRDDLDIANCPVRNVLDRFGDKWSVLVMINLGNNGIMRFNELQKSIPDISQKMLTATLRSLEADGIVSRSVYAEVPPRVEYQLTELGETLLPHIRGLSQWAFTHMATILKNRAGKTDKDS